MSTPEETTENVTVGIEQDEKKQQKKPFNKKEKKPFVKKDADGNDATTDKDAAAKKEAKKKADAKKNPDEPYIFIIKNVENDLCRIHESALPQFLGLNVGNQAKRCNDASYYEVKIRSETRTGELTFHGKDETSLFRGVNPTAQSKVNINKKAGEKREREAEGGAEGATTPAEGGEATTTAASSSAPRYATVSDMLDNMRNVSYFNSHLNYKHATGADAANPLMSHLASAVAEVNKKFNPKALRKALKDVPGFLSCWFLKATGPNTSVFRVVFNTEAELLSAKEMLDQFEADEGIRVTIKLSDNLAAKFQKFLLEKAGGGEESADVVQLSGIDSANLEE